MTPAQYHGRSALPDIDGGARAFGIAGLESPAKLAGARARLAGGGPWWRTTGAALIALSVTTGTAFADQDVVAVKVAEPPVIDGDGDDAAWSRTGAVTTTDAVAAIPLTLKAVHTGDTLFLLVQYPDPTEDREHETMVWDESAKLYRVGPKREDTFVFKWDFGPSLTDLTLSANAPYKADIWFWKAYRTDHAGHADDKMHIYSITPQRRATSLLHASGRTFYLLRPGDAGEAAYRLVVRDKYEGELTARYRLVQPSGSRADVRAKGQWKEGKWTIEFGRRLDTGHADDIQFRLDRSHFFGVSRYEIAGRRRDPTIEQPDYGAGDVGERLKLIFE